ncbi:extracellular ligand-binding receptor [Candidatus Magnetomorum sp. HK-1]|nr:extracellular ligand-binding receptor [Candidatus Magnetomorum sp. HK-1]
MKNKYLIGFILFCTFLCSLWLTFSKPKKIISEKPKPDIYRLRFGHNMPEDSAHHLSAMRFADIVNYKSKGKIIIDVYPNQQLGTDQQMIEMARAGELAIIIPPTAKMTTLIPEMQLLDLPFLFPTRKKLYEMLDGKPGQMLLEKMTSQGLIGVTFWESGFKQFTANKEIHSPSDFKGLNIRTMKSQIIMEQFKAFGANPIPIDFHKTYQALKDGVIDGQENPLISIYGLKFYEFQTHVTISNHAYIALAFTFSKKIFEKLPGDIQEILYSTALEITPFERKEIIIREKELIQKIKATNTKIYRLSPEESLNFKEVSKKIYDYYRPIGGDILNQVQHLLKQKNQAQNNEIIIGLNADLVAGGSLAGQSIKRGMKLAVNEINQKGGVLGKKLSIVTRDNSGISARGIDNMNFFSSLNNLVAVMGGIYSPIALDVLDIIHQKELIYLIPWAAATRIIDNGYNPNYVFRVSVRDEFAGPFLINKALIEHKKIALLLVNDGWGKGNYQSMTDALAQKKLAPVAVEWFNWGEKDMNSQLERIEKKEAEVILLVAGSAEGEIIIKNLSRRSIKIPVISHWGITGGHFWKSVNRELDNVSLSFLQSFSFINVAEKKQQELVKNYFQTYNVNHPGKIFAPVGTAHAYDLVHLLAIAIQNAGTLDRSAIRNALEKINRYQGVVKNYDPPFTPTRHDALDQTSFFLAKYNQNGYIVPIKE